MATNGGAFAGHYTPAQDTQVLASIPAGGRHTASKAPQAAQRLDVALPLARINIERSRTTGDPRFLGYAEALLKPWLKREPVSPDVRVLQATILQSRHAFLPALDELDVALAARPDDAQALLARANILRVLGRYPAAARACDRLIDAGAAEIGVVCRESLRGLSGQLDEAYAALSAMHVDALPLAVRVSRTSELGEMSVRLGDDVAAERWFRAGLALAPNDLYLKGAYADLLLRQNRPTEALQLLSGRESSEPMLLRIAMAQAMAGDACASRSRDRLAQSFATETSRGDAVHRREEARFLLDVEGRPQEALRAAKANWQQQREPEDVLIFIRSARAAGAPQEAAPALKFTRENRLQDARTGADLRAGAGVVR